LERHGLRIGNGALDEHELLRTDDGASLQLAPLLVVEQSDGDGDPADLEGIQNDRSLWAAISRKARRRPSKIGMAES
jgi:hypothetical protein